MKKLFIIIILSLCFTTPSHTNDISDFQIEGVSVGDSALDYFSKEEIEKAFSIVKSSYDSDKFKRALFFSPNFEKLTIALTSFLSPSIFTILPSPNFS